jgi:hypothetical protein
MMWNMFFISCINIAAIGPSEKPPIKAGRSLMSIFKKAGNIGMGNSNSINTKAIADNSPTFTIPLKENIFLDNTCFLMDSCPTILILLLIDFHFLTDPVLPVRLS